MSVMIIDKYLLRKSINKGESSVLAAAAIYIAAKYE